MDGYIALFRQFMDWEWYDDANTMRLFIHCLLLANYRDKQWRGKTIKRGQFITSQPKLANSLKLSIMQIRNSLSKLKSTGEITVKTTAEYSIITVNNYDLFQEDNRQKNSQNTKNEQSSNRLTTTTNKDNNSTSISYINTHTIECEEITKEDELILRNYAKKSKANNIDAYVHALITNGAYKDILVKEKERIQRKKEKEDFPRIEPVVLTEQEKAEIAEIQKRTRENLRRKL